MADCHCEMCGEEFASNHLHHAVTINVRPSLGTARDEEDAADRDHLLELHELLEQTTSMDLEGDADPLEEARFTFVLCEACRSRFCEDPLQRDSLGQLAISDIGFSDN